MKKADPVDVLPSFLHHGHLPKLVEGDLVHYDARRETVTGLDTIESVRPYLDLALVDDVR